MSTNMNLVLNTLPNNAKSICKRQHAGYFDRLQKDLPDNPNYVVFDYQTVTETEHVFFTMEAIKVAEKLGLENVILSYTTEALHRKFWEISISLLSKAGYKKVLLIDAGTDVAVEWYIDVCQESTKVRFSTSSTWFDVYSGKPGYKENIPLEHKRSKHFISLARYSRKERIQFTCKILDDKFLRPKGRLSCGWADYELGNDYWGKDKPLWNLIPTHLKNYFPLSLGDQPEQQHDLLPHIADNVFNVVLEGVIGHNPASYSVNSDTSNTGGRYLTVNSDRMMPTEKTTKAFAMNQIPLILATPGMVHTLRSMNFDMFDDVIDHSYDKENCIENRMNMILEQLKKVCEKDLGYWEEFILNNKQRFHHNQQHVIRISEHLHEQNKQVVKEFFV